jgi:hypothetical protein
MGSAGAGRAGGGREGGGSGGGAGVPKGSYEAGPGVCAAEAAVAVSRSDLLIEKPVCMRGRIVVRTCSNCRARRVQCAMQNTSRCFRVPAAPARRGCTQLDCTGDAAEFRAQRRESHSCIGTDVQLCGTREGGPRTRQGRARRTARCGRACRGRTRRRRSHRRSRPAAAPTQTQTQRHDCVEADTTPQPARAGAHALAALHDYPSHMRHSLRLRKARMRRTPCAGADCMPRAA